MLPCLHSASSITEKVFDAKQIPSQSLLYKLIFFLFTYITLESRLQNIRVYGQDGIFLLRCNIENDRLKKGQTANVNSLLIADFT